MTGFLDLPPELRNIIYNDVLQTIPTKNDPIVWLPDVLEVDIDKHPTIAISRLQITGLEYGRLSAGLQCQYPSLYLRDIAPLVSLARTSKILHDEILQLAWSICNLEVRGTLDMICTLLGPRLALHTTPLIKSSIKTLELTIYNPWGLEGLHAMKEIVELINTHLPALERLDLSFPNLLNRGSNIQNPLHLPAKEVFAQLLLLRSELLVVFHITQKLVEKRGERIRLLRLYWPFRDELAALLTDIYASHRATVLDRQRKRQDRELFDLDYYLLETTDLRSAIHNEERF